MRKLAIGIIAAGTMVAAVPAMAQVYLEGPGVGVRVGPEPYYRDHDRWDRRPIAQLRQLCVARSRLPDGNGA